MSNTLDGYTVDEFNGKFQGKFPIDYEDGESIERDDIVTFVVTGFVKKVEHDTDRHDNLVRTNSFAVKEVAVVPTGKVAQLKSALATDGNLLALFSEKEEELDFEVDEKDIADWSEDDEELSV